MTTSIDLRELPARLEEALGIVASGREVILTDGAMPRVRMVPCGEQQPPVPGLHAGAFQPAPDFDASLPDDFWAGQE